MQDLINYLNVDEIEKIAIENHRPRKDAVYIMVKKDMHFVEKTAEEFSKSNNNIIKDYYSVLINMNKSVDKGKKIQSNNKYTIFIKNTNELTKNRLEDYYNALECDEKESKKYIEFLLNNKEEFILNYNNKLIKIFFSASVKEYEEEGKKYFYKNVFATKEYKTTLNRDNEEIGVPLTLNMNPKKPFLISNPTELKYPAMYTKETCYKIKCLLDCFKGFWIQGFDKAYFCGNKIIPIRHKHISSENIPNSTFVQFAMDNRGQMFIKDLDTITRYRVDLFRNNIYFYYQNINELFYDNDLYDYITENLKSSNYDKNESEKQRASGILKEWFLKGNYPDKRDISLLERYLGKIAKNELCVDYDLDIKRIHFLKHLSTNKYL